MILQTGGNLNKGSGGITETIKSIGEILKIVSGGEQNPATNAELNGLANRIVTLSLRKTLKDVEKNLGVTDHVTISAK